MPKYKDNFGVALRNLSVRKPVKRNRLSWHNDRSIALPDGPIFHPDSMPGPRVPDHVLAERERVRAFEPTIHQALLGDPLPGRSALDKRRPRVVVDNG